MNLALVEEQSARVVAAGVRILQPHRFGADERAHVARLERWAEFPRGARVMDMGSGTGEMVRILRELRPDLRFCLVNLSPVQLGYSPEGIEQHCCDFRSVPEPTASVDAMMFCHAIGHEKAADALQEAGRLLRPGGVLFVVDMARVHSDNSTLDEIQYHVGPRAEMEAAACGAGFSLDVYLEPVDSGQFGAGMWGAEAHAQLFSGTVPAIWRFIRNPD